MLWCRQPEAGNVLTASLHMLQGQHTHTWHELRHIGLSITPQRTTMQHKLATSCSAREQEHPCNSTAYCLMAS